MFQTSQASTARSSELASGLANRQYTYCSHLYLTNLSTMGSNKTDVSSEGGHRVPAGGPEVAETLTSLNRQH
jgi:hypothetical protein